MTEPTHAPATPDGATNYEPPTYEIDPADQPIADVILALDPLRDIGGSGKIGAGVRVPAAVPLSALPPELQAAVAEKVRHVPTARRADAEADAIREVLFARTGSTRLLTGLAADAPAYHQEEVQIARDYQAAAREFERIVADMTKVARWENGTDAEGNPQPKPVYAMTATESYHASNRLAALDYKMKLLVAEDGSPGPEAARRLKVALKESVEQHKAKQAELAEHRDAEALAIQMLRDERVKAKAELFAKHKRVIR